jgi:5-bromo-4-chloroindolyl phosphate hydrolysis protein
MRSLFGNDWNWIVAGLVAAILVPVLSFLVGLPFWIAVVIAAVVFAGLVLILAPRQLFEGIDTKAIGSGRVAFARDLLSEAQPYAEQLRGSAGQIRDKDTAQRVRHLAEIATDVFAKVEANPGSAGTVKRFLSYYVPRSAEVAEGFAILEAKRAPDKAKLDEVRTVLVKLEEAFVHYADSLVDDELGSLDTDLRLIQASLKEDIQS